METTPALLTIDRLLIRLREDARLGVAAASRAAGVDRTSLWRWERGRRWPDYDQLQALLDLYAAGVDDRAEAERRRRLHAHAEQCPEMAL